MSTKRVLYKTKLVQIKDHNPLVRELLIKLVEPNEFIFKAGQFVMLNIPSDNPEKPILRAYSVASDDRIKNSFRLIFKFIPGGVASTYVWKLKESDELYFTGPFGRVVFVEPPAKNIYFLCTGTGLAQHLSFLESKLDLFPQNSFQLIFGNYNEDHLFYTDELKKLSTHHPHFKYLLTLSDPMNSWKGKKGFVQEHLKELISKPNQSLNDSLFYLCGNGNMINATKTLLTETYKANANQIHSEAF
jgi:CDP-4-dehydro-6-deoxyglucose reductase, E3